MLRIATRARERVKNRGRKRRAWVSVIEGAFPIRFPARANKQKERRVVVEEEIRRKEDNKAVFSVAPFYSGWRAWPCRRRAYQLSSWKNTILSKCDLWCTCFITKTEVLFFLSLCSRSWFLGENSLSQLSRFTFLFTLLFTLMCLLTPERKKCEDYARRGYLITISKWTIYCSPNPTGW